MSELARGVANVLVKTREAGIAHTWSLGKTQRSHGVTTGAQRAASETEEALGQVTENAQTIVAALKTGQGEFNTAADLQTASTTLAKDALESAEAVIGDSTVEHATQAVTHLLAATAEVDDGLVHFSRAHGEVEETIRLAGQLVETLGSAATTLATLREKLNDMHHATLSSSTHVADARTRNKSAVTELEAYLNGIR